MRNLLSLLRRAPSLPPARAKELLGPWMALPEDVERHLGVRYSQADLERLGSVPWSEQVLGEAAGEYALFPGYPVTLLELADKGCSSCLLSLDPGQMDWLRKQRFASRARVGLRWYLVGRLPRQKGTGTFSENVAAAGRDFELPLAAEAAF
ncbi:MAG: hypothetical protein KGL53_14065, partial [Elusimicrobia bacterium]|nr:hypothetical protein [Elusimicrobiota bacterium]